MKNQIANVSSSRSLTKNERSLLLFFETCAVDYGGTLESIRMNNEDMIIAKRWNSEGFVKFGRLSSETINNTIGKRIASHWCELSDEAWKEAHKERKDRFQRIFTKRTYVRT